MKLTGRSGFVSKAPTGVPAENPWFELPVALMFGGLVGLVIGILLSSVLRYLSLVTGRKLDGGAWPVYSAVLGAVLVGIWTWVGG